MKYTYLDCLALFGVGGAHPGGLQLTKKILAKENINGDTALLEVGCGTGQTAAYLAQQYGCSVSALDNNSIMVEKAQQRFSSLDLPIDAKVGDTENLPYPDKKFDIVLSESVISFTNLISTIPEIKRVLKQNGKLLAIETVLEQSIPEEERSQIVDFYSFPQLLTEGEWVKAFRDAEFHRIDATKYEPRLEQVDEQHAADYSLSETIDDALLEILGKHEEIMHQNKDKLGFRIFRCS
ncbi:SAM-dependent methyltransferase [Terribacillus saccharophilus]|uniref:class I SAM-dependent methyltransferase n=1 Tax=Terribacillus saccharophilus TaxID=361277 RepID=UPI000BA5BB69|nr:class I SAM-dependent methyltransferase [Terribacillus saccharophilus]PAF23093.1 SAM-dependent methyltransferase [Terribacillus saccharophilus]